MSHKRHVYLLKNLLLIITVLLQGCQRRETSLIEPLYQYEGIIKICVENKSYRLTYKALLYPGSDYELKFSAPLTSSLRVYRLSDSIEVYQGSTKLDEDEIKSLTNSYFGDLSFDNFIEFVHKGSLASKMWTIERLPKSTVLNSINRDLRVQIFEKNIR